MPAGTKMPEDLSEMKRYAKTMFDYAAKIALKENFQQDVARYVVLRIPPLVHL
jgi:hypothetical protein